MLLGIRKDIKVDVWWTDPANPYIGERERKSKDVFTNSIVEGKGIMRNLKLKGMTGICMYVRPADGKHTSLNRYYYFDKSGKIKFDKDNY